MFSGVTIRVFDDTKYLSTNESTILEAKDDNDIEHVNLTSDEIKDNIIEGNCIGVQIKQEQCCVICNNTLEAQSEKTDTVTCKYCNVTMLSTTCHNKLVCNVMIKTSNGKIQSYTCFNDALQSFLTPLIMIPTWVTYQMTNYKVLCFMLASRK